MFTPIPVGSGDYIEGLPTTLKLNLLPNHDNSRLVSMRKLLKLVHL